MCGVLCALFVVGCRLFGWSLFVVCCFCLLCVCCVLCVVCCLFVLLCAVCRSSCVAYCVLLVRCLVWVYVVCHVMFGNWCLVLGLCCLLLFALLVFVIVC